MLRKYRINNKLTQNELANKIGARDSTVSHYETGKRVPNFNTFQKLSNVLKLNNKQKLNLLKWFSENGKED